MKKLSISLAALMFFLAANTSQAWFATGYILCDGNQNRTIDLADTGIPSVLVLVTNTSGTFSNAGWTGPDGYFLIALPEDAGSYVETLVAETLPPDSGVLVPNPPAFSFSLPNGDATVFDASWLINNPGCQDVGGCWLTGGGTVGSGKKPDHSFGGNVYPGCFSTAGQGGQWTDVAHNLKLQFQGTVVQTVRCGNIVGIPPGSDSPVTPFNFIEFSGTGTLKGIGGNKANYGTVNFYARAEDSAEPGKKTDRYYLRVYSTDGTTLMLVSGDPSNPENIVPMQTSGGNLQLHEKPCP
jgi:hypothetical protein